MGKEALGTEVPLSILFLGFHFSHCFELSNIIGQGVGCQISVMFWVVLWFLSTEVYLLESGVLNALEAGAQLLKQCQMGLFQLPKQKEGG